MIFKLLFWTVSILKSWFHNAEVFMAMRAFNRWTQSNSAPVKFAKEE